MMRTSATSQAVLSASLLSIMNAAEIGSVPVEVVDGCHMRFGVAGSKQRPIHTLINWGATEIIVESIPGYWESATEGVLAPSGQLQRAWLEAGDFFKDWKGLQRQMNWVSRLGGKALENTAQSAESPFELAVLYDAMGRRRAALEKYVEAASDHKSRGEYTLAAIVWECAMATLIPSERYEYGSAFRREAALSYLESLGDFKMPYDPHSLKLVRGLWHAHACDNPAIYTALLIKWIEYKEKRSMPRERASNELRLALSLLNHRKLDSKDWTTASDMIESAVTLIRGMEDLRINVDMLLGLAAETASFAKARTSISPYHGTHDPTQR